MSKYMALRNKIDKMKKTTIGSIAPYLAWFNKISDGYNVTISFWDGKQGSGEIMPPKVVLIGKTFTECEGKLISYLEKHKPMKPFVLFSDEDGILE